MVLMVIRQMLFFVLFVRLTSSSVHQHTLWAHPVAVAWL